MARLNISDVLLLFVFVRVTSLPTHILLSPDSLPPPERFHLKCSFEFYCRLLISTLTCTSGFTFKHSVLQLGRHDIFPQISSITVHKICNFPGYFLRDESVLLCAFTFSAPSSRQKLPLGRNEATCTAAIFLLNTNTFQQFPSALFSTVSFTYCGISICLRDMHMVHDAPPQLYCCSFSGKK